MPFRRRSESYRSSLTRRGEYVHCNCTVICGMYVVRAFPCVGCFMGCNACFTGGVCVCVVWYGVGWGGGGKGSLKHQTVYGSFFE